LPVESCRPKEQKSNIANTKIKGIEQLGIDVPFTEGTSEGFREVFRGDFQRWFQRGTGAGAAASSSEVDEAYPNRSNTFDVVPAPLTLIQGSDFFPPCILTLATEAFLARLRPELPELNFLLGFKALVSTNSWVEVWSPERNYTLACLHFLPVS
jgi:hypothetical protein